MVRVVGGGGAKSAQAGSRRRALFGGADAETTTPGAPGAGGQKRARQEDVGAVVNLRESSIMGRLVTTELEGALSSSLLDREPTLTPPSPGPR